MDVYVLYDVANQKPEPISWLFILSVWLCLPLAIIPWRKLYKRGLRKCASAYAIAMALAVVYITFGSFMSYRLDKSRLAECKNWKNDVKYEVVQGNCVFLDAAGGCSLLKIGNKVFEYGPWCEVNTGIPTNIIEELKSTNKLTRIYYTDRMILCIEVERK